MDEIEKQNEEFCKWLRDIGKLERACDNGKSYMVNPKAMQTILSLTRFFQEKSNKHVFDCKSAGIKGEPYTIKTTEPGIVSKSITLIVSTNDIDSVSFTAKEMEQLQTICGNDIVMEIAGSLVPEQLQFSFYIENYYIEVKPK